MAVRIYVVMINIGYSTGLKAVYTTHLKGKDPKDFLDCTKGGVDPEAQIK